jgi:hypothetical protein
VSFHLRVLRAFVKSEFIGYTDDLVMLLDYILAYVKGDEGDPCMGGFTNSLACAALLVSSDLLEHLETDDS